MFFQKKRARKLKELHINTSVVKDWVRKKTALPTSHFGVIGRGFNMAAAEGVCPFPLPPSQYFKLYTDENVENKTAPDPPPTLKGTYSMFGASFEVN